MRHDEKNLGIQKDPGLLWGGLELLFLFLTMSLPDPQVPSHLPYPGKVTVGSLLPKPLQSHAKIGQPPLLPVSKLFSINVASQGISKRGEGKKRKKFS